MKLKATIVFEKIWNAIHEMSYNVDGTPHLDDNGSHMRRYKYIILEGGSRSSKTISAIDCYDLYARKEENKRLTVWRDTKTDCKKTVLHDMQKHIKRTGRFNLNYVFNKTESIFTYKTSTTVEIHGCDDEETVHGMEQDAAWFNEPYKIPKEVFDQVDQRTTEFIFLDWNPKKAHFIDSLKKDPRALLIKSTFKDNPFCPPEERRKILSYQPISRCEVVEKELITESEAREYNVITNILDFTIIQIKELSRCRENEYKGSANEFNWSVYGLGEKSERPNRIFRFNEIQDNVYHELDAQIYTASDWGAVDPWAILDCKYYDGALYFHERHYKSENILKADLTPTELDTIKGVDEGIVSWVFNRLGIDKNRTIICDPNRTTKIMALRDAGYDYSIAALKPPGSIIDGISGLSNMMVFYTKSSDNFKYEQENYSRKVDRYGIVLEEAEDVDNHLMDCARYLYAFLRSQGIIKTI